jgi:RNA polymerase sigma-B factor
VNHLPQRHPEMSGEKAREEDRELLRRYHEQGDTTAREELIERHLPLVRSLARRYAGRGEALEDIEQVGAIGLIKAIDRFELAREVSLATYATPNVVGEIKRHFRDKGWAIRVPRALQELNASMSGAIERLTARLGRSPSIAEIAEELKTSPEEVLEAMEVGSAYSTVPRSAACRRGSAKSCACVSRRDCPRPKSRSGSGSPRCTSRGSSASRFR